VTANPYTGIVLAVVRQFSRFLLVLLGVGIVIGFCAAALQRVTGSNVSSEIHRPTVIVVMLSTFISIEVMRAIRQRRKKY
jgi:hypothetical protein